MAEFKLTIQASVAAKNIHSARKKAQAIEDHLAKKGWETPEVRLRGGTSK